MKARQMPSYSYEDKLMIMQEQSLWTCVELLKNELSAMDNAWSDRLKALHDEALKIAKELQQYNEQWEES